MVSTTNLSSFVSDIQSGLTHQYFSNQLLKAPNLLFFNEIKNQDANTHSFLNEIFKLSNYGISSIEDLEKPQNKALTKLMKVGFQNISTFLFHQHISIPLEHESNLNAPTVFKTHSHFLDGVYFLLFFSHDKYLQHMLPVQSMRKYIKKATNNSLVGKIIKKYNDKNIINSDIANEYADFIVNEFQLYQSHSNSYLHNLTTDKFDDCIFKCKELEKYFFSNIQNSNINAGKILNSPIWKDTKYLLKKPQSFFELSFYFMIMQNNSKNYNQTNYDGYQMKDTIFSLLDEIKTNQQKSFPNNENNLENILNNVKQLLNNHYFAYLNSNSFNCPHIDNIIRVEDKFNKIFTNKSLAQLQLDIVLDKLSEHTFFQNFHAELREKRLKAVLKDNDKNSGNLTDKDKARKKL